MVEDGDKTYLIGTGYDLGKLPVLFILTLYNCLDDRGMIRTQVHEAVSYTSLARG